MNQTVAQDEQLRRYVETHHIDMIPAGARHGKPWQQLPFWAGAIITGTLAGALFIALHATQGPRLGVPQTIQSRGQFGFYGAAFLFPCVLLLVIDMLSWAPFVSDYTRYLPVNTSGRRLFWTIYGGNVITTILSCVLGAYLAALLPDLSPVAAIGKISGKWALG